MTRPKGDGPAALPGWYEDWVLAQRDRIRQLLLEQLAQLAEDRLRDKRYGEALAACLAYRSLLGAEPTPRMRQRVDSIATLSTRTVGQLLASD